MNSVSAPQQNALKITILIFLMDHWGQHKHLPPFHDK